MTESALQSYLVAMRGFMRQVRDPDFRAYLKRYGWSTKQDVVIAFDDETVATLVSRLAFNEASNPCLVAIPHGDERFGFRLMLMGAVARRRSWRDPPGERVSPQATVGMLYSAVTECDAYVPSEWTRPVTFSKVPEPA